MLKGREADWIGHISHRNCRLKLIIEGKMEEMGRQEKRRKQLQDYLKETRGYWKLKEEVEDLTLWRTCFGLSQSPVHFNPLLVKKCSLYEKLNIFDVQTLVVISSIC
jgi:hypothetical protein